MKEAIEANVANFLGELGRLASWSNSCLLEPQLRAQEKKSRVLFSFKRIYSIFLVNWEDWLPGRIRVF